MSAQRRPRVRPRGGQQYRRQEDSGDSNLGTWLALGVGAVAAAGGIYYLMRSKRNPKATIESQTKELLNQMKDLGRTKDPRNLQQVMSLLDQAMQVYRDNEADVPPDYLRLKAFYTRQLSGKPEDAVRFARSAIKSGGQSSKYYYELGMCLSFAKEYTEATTQLQHAKQLTAKEGEMGKACLIEIEKGLAHVAKRAPLANLNLSSFEGMYEQEKPQTRQPGPLDAFFRPGGNPQELQERLRAGDPNMDPRQAFFAQQQLARSEAPKQAAPAANRTSPSKPVASASPAAAEARDDIAVSLNVDDNGLVKVSFATPSSPASATPALASFADSIEDLRSGLMEKLFRKLDTDKDGLVSESDLAAEFGAERARDLMSFASDNKQLTAAQFSAALGAVTSGNASNSGSRLLSASDVADSQLMSSPVSVAQSQDLGDSGVMVDPKDADASASSGSDQSPSDASSDHSVTPALHGVHPPGHPPISYAAAVLHATAEEPAQENENEEQTRVELDVDGSGNVSLSLHHD